MQPATVQFVTGHYTNTQERQEARTRIRTHAANISRWRQWTRLIDRHAARNLAQQALPGPAAEGRAQDAAGHQRAFRDVALVTVPDSSTGAPREDYENWTQHLALTLSIEQFFDTINVSFPLPVEQLSVLPSGITLNALQQVYCMLDQTFLPSKQSGLNKTAAVFMQRVVEDAGLLHGFVFAQLVRNKAADRRMTKKAEYCLLESQHQAVQYVNARLENVQTACDDNNILIVLLLAYSGKVLGREEARTVPSQGPLKSLQLLDLYGGAINVEPTHEQGLVRMVQLRGGVDRLVLPGLSQMLCYADIIYSSRRLTRPRFPFVAAFKDDHEKVLQSLRRPDRRLVFIARGFGILATVVPHGIAQPLQSTLQLLSLYTLAVEDYIIGSQFGQSLVVLADQRNMCQHGLLSLTPESGSQHEHALIHICRISTTIYSFLCIYPISSAPFNELSSTIKTVLATRTFEKFWREAPALLVWVVVMGAIASIGTEHRTWFIAVLDRCLSKLKIETWEALKELLQEFLWLPSTNDADGYDLWLEVEESSPFKLGENSTYPDRMSAEDRRVSYP